jgi:peptidoglycan/LPS O-acetylase OafA/YrhL
MILGIEIGLLIFGILALARGTFSVGKEKKVTGWRARVLGLICLTPFPVAITVMAALNGQGEPDYRVLAGVEVVIVVAICVLVVVLSKAFYAQQRREAAASKPSHPGAEAYGVDPGPFDDPDNPFAPPRARS